MNEPVLDGYMRVITLDGPRKGREYYFKADTREFGINSPVPQDVMAAYYGEVSGYGQYIYRVVAVWGLSPVTKTYGGLFVRLAYK